MSKDSKKKASKWWVITDGRARVISGEKRAPGVPFEFDGDLTHCRAFIRPAVGGTDVGSDAAAPQSSPRRNAVRRERWWEGVGTMEELLARLSTAEVSTAIRMKGYDVTGDHLTDDALIATLKRRGYSGALKAGAPGAPGVSISVEEAADPDAWEDADKGNKDKEVEAAPPAAPSNNLPETGEEEDSGGPSPSGGLPEAPPFEVLRARAEELAEGGEGTAFSHAKSLAERITGKDISVRGWSDLESTYDELINAEA